MVTPKHGDGAFYIDCSKQHPNDGYEDSFLVSPGLHPKKNLGSYRD